ncbi:WD40 repeat-like protein [Abortiporus biennis]|nr:WD40 repeat-like protein [Abortiporus biennis]
MRPTDTDADSTLSISVPEAGPSSAVSLLSNGHNGVVKSNGFNGLYTNGTTKSHSLDGVDGHKLEKVEKPSRASVSRVSLPGTTLYDDSYVDREEFVRLVIQSLRDVGYIESAATLEAESGYTMETPQVSEFRQCILDGAWSNAETALMHLGVNEDALLEAKFLISQQKYLELLEAGKIGTALNILRNELAPMNIDSEHLHSLSSLLMCSDPSDLRQRAGWDGISGSSRRKLLMNLQRYIPSSVMIPQRRFSTLLDQARLYQQNRCLYHNAPTNARTFSLYTDHLCDKDAFPSMTTASLEVHTDEVWNMQWSHSGNYLATASKDRTAIIWRIGVDKDPQSRELFVLHTLDDHQDPVGCVAWSLDDTILLTASESTIRMWNTKTGVCIRTIDHHSDVVTALIWLPNNSGFISGGLDRKIILWDAEGKIRDNWGRMPIRVTDLAITPDFTRLVAVGMSDPPPIPHPVNPTPTEGASSQAATQTHPNSRPSENRILIYDLATKEIETSKSVEGELTSVKISEDSQYALINHAAEAPATCEVMLWDLHAERVVRTYTGLKHARHVIRSCFGGVDDNFIASGSEDAMVYVWKRETGELLEILKGHGDGSVNCVAWNPRNERMFASCSDDHTIRIWEAPLAHIVNPSAVANEEVAVEPEEDITGKGKGKGREIYDGDGMDGVFGMGGTSASL